MAKSFKDEIIIDGKKVLDIPIENMFYEEKTFEFKSKWTDPEIRKKPQTADVKLTREGLNKANMVFDPLKAIVHSEPKLAIAYGESEAIKPIVKKTGWGEEWEKTFNPPPLNAISRNLNLEEVEYLLRLHRLDDLNKKQKDAVLEVAEPEVRSPPPEPIYDGNGRRINTLEHTVKSAMMVEKNNLIEDCQRMNVGFMTPLDWKVLKRTRKIYVPEYDNPELSYVALILGPGGRTQRIIEDLSNCRISVKGRQAGSSRKNLHNQQEQTHVLVQAEDDESLEKGAEIVQKVLRGESLQQIASQEKKFIRTGYEMLAVETVLRNFCENCKEEGHKLWNCPYMFSSKLNKRGTNKTESDYLIIKCEKCGAKTHLTRDCPRKKRPQEEADDADLDKEYYNFLKEVKLGEAEILDIDEQTGQAHELTDFITEPKIGEEGKKMIKHN